LRKEKLGRRFTEDDNNDEIGGRSGRVDEQRAFGKPQFSSRLLQGVHGGATLFFTQWKNALFTGSG
jgi:hypothetical protein